MSKLRAIVPALALLVASLCSFQAGAADAKAGGVYGKAPAAAETTPIARLLADPEAFDGKTIKVQGTVLDVCPKAGCWMELGAPDGAVRIKVDDGVIVFPVDAKGKPAIAEGKVEVKELTREQYLRWEQHLAEERNETFDPAELGEGPFRLIEIHATGAQIGDVRGEGR